MEDNNMKEIDDMIDQRISKEDFEKKDISRLILTITQQMAGGDLTIQFGETTTYGDLLFAFLCTADALAKDNPKIGNIDKVIDDLVSMSKHEEFHKNNK